MKKSELEHAARLLMASRKVAMLSTYSQDAEMGNYPFGSMVRFAVAEDGSPLLVLSRIAEHSKHIAKNSSISLLINGQEIEGKEQETERLTLLGELHCLDQKGYSQQELQDIAQPYFDAYPESLMYWQTMDFDIYKLEIHKARYIMGFARAHWLKQGFEKITPLYNKKIGK